jgi:Zn-dependent M28 family amino/carboxypeptidase
VIEVRDFEELRARADEARGKIVFFNRPMDASLFNSFAAYGGAVNQRSRGAVEAARVGGVAAVVRSMTTRRDDFPHTGAMRYEDGVERVPSVAVSTNGAELLSELIASGQEPTLTLKLDCRWHADKPSFNVVGELVGSERPDEVVVVGGHLDAWDVGQGAHDDGGGCVQAFEVVRLLKALDLRPRRTIRAVMFMNEENGLRGGRAYHADNEDAMAGHVMALESDRGVFTPRGFTSDANPAALAILQDIVALMEDAGIHVMVPGYGGVDISPMAASGVPLVGFLPDCQRYFDLHHSARDTMEQVSDREINLGAGAMAALCYVVADLPETLPRNTIPDTATSR